MLLDSDGDGISDENELISGTNPSDSGSRFPVDENVEIDVLFFYTPKFTTDTGHGDPVLEINQQIQAVNDMYENSGADISFRAVHYQPVEHVVDNVQQSLDLLRNGAGPFSDRDFLRASYGADVIFLLDGIINKNQACGKASLGGYLSLGDFSANWQRDAHTGFSFLPGGNNTAINLICGEETLAHELGHVLGLDHSRVQQSTGTFPWALGHGLTGSFVYHYGLPAVFPRCRQLAGIFQPPA